jgi:hypothetical protein
MTAASRDQRGVALVTTMLIMLLMSALMIGFTTAVMSDQRYRYIDKDRVRAFYAAQSGLEKLSSDLALLFFSNVAPSDSQVSALGEADAEPDINGITFTTSGSGEAYGVTPIPLAPGDDGWDIISSGPYQGLIALKRSYRLDSSARTASGGEAHLKRDVETVAIPVFQFGIFSDVDLSFHAGPNFNFGGRVHSNRHLFLSHGDGATLTLPEKVTAVGEIVRNRLANDNLVANSNHEGTVNMARAPGAFRALLQSEGSVVDGLTSALNDPLWTSTSLSTYNGYIRNGRTGAKVLRLPVVTLGFPNDAIVKRPADDEASANPALLAERFFTKVSLRILLSDTDADITGLPGITAGAPVPLEDWSAAQPAGYVIGAGRPPIARSPGPAAASPVVRTAAAAGTNVDVRLWGNVPAYWRHTNPMTITDTGGVVQATDLTCTGKTETTFTGCTTGFVGTVGVNWVISSTRPTVDGNVPVSTTVTANWNTGAGTTVTVANTLSFARNTIWFRNTDDNQNVMATCEGYDDGAWLLDCNLSNAVDVNAELLNQSLSTAGTGLIGGRIKIEMQEADNDWRDVTAEILSHGIGAPNQPWRTGAGALTGLICPDPSPNAIIRLQRLRDNTETGAGPCSYAGSTVSEDYWPNTLFDTREALYRDVSPGNNNLVLGGVMHYVTIDVGNLSNWFRGVGAYAGGSGPQALSINGYAVYFSDRRNNRNLTNEETGEYGNEDIINPGTANGAANAGLDAGEDVNANAVLDAYGNLASYNGVRGTAPPGAAGPLVGTATHTAVAQMGQAKVNRAILFRHALKLANGMTNIVTPGLTIASENPVYVQGDWNAVGTFAGAHAATSIVADSVTILSNAWNDNISYTFPYSPGSRPRSAASWYRFAVIAGKNDAFPRSAVIDAVPQDFGTDGGAHNFLRMLEGGGGTVNYRGSIATFYFSRQATGIYKCCATVYGAPTRNFNFDTDFLNPALLPPLTPVFRDINALGFRQEIRPGF